MSEWERHSAAYRRRARWRGRRINRLLRRARDRSGLAEIAARSAAISLMAADIADARDDLEKRGS